jgi:hypothetical protein
MSVAFLVLISLSSCGSSWCKDSALLVQDDGWGRAITCNPTATASFTETSRGIILLCTCPKDMPSEISGSSLDAVETP